MLQGYSFTGLSAGLKANNQLDVGVIKSDHPASAAAVFTRNIFKGAPLIVGEEHLRDGKLQAVLVNSKNANVANGFSGLERARDSCRLLAEHLKIDSSLVFPSSTGVIGRPLPIEKISSVFSKVPSSLSPEGHNDFARAIMTTDLVPKVVEVKAAGGTILGIAKGSGMIEPNMATMLAYILTDLDIEPERLQQFLHIAVNESFNCISVDTDTSTSDTALLMANGAAGKLEDSHSSEFQEALSDVCRQLAVMIAIDGEGASKLITVDCTGAADYTQARTIAKLVVNSPLVKTAVKGADPNWGRILMAIGKSFDERIHPASVRIYALQTDSYSNYQPHGTALSGLDKSDPAAVKAGPFSCVDLMREDEASLKQLEDLFSRKEVHLVLDLGLGRSFCRVWGCDLTEGYVHINADYTT